MISGLANVNGYSVIAQMKDMTSETAQSIVVCDRGTASKHDRYAVWTVATLEGKVVAWNGNYMESYEAALMRAVWRSTFAE